MDVSALKWYLPDGSLDNNGAGNMKGRVEQVVTFYFLVQTVCYQFKIDGNVKYFM